MALQPLAPPFSGSSIVLAGLPIVFHACRGKTIARTKSTQNPTSLPFISRTPPSAFVNVCRIRILARRTPKRGNDNALFVFVWIINHSCCY